MAYTAIVFDEDTILKLEEEYVALTKNHTEDWENKFHHLTVCMGTNSKGKYPFQLGDRVKVKITRLGHSPVVTAFRCELPEGKSVKSNVPHITCKVNRVDGGKPKHSNDISEWIEIDPFSVTGVVQVCE